MAIGATIYNLDVNLSNVDRNTYETLAIKVARHPSETEEYLLTRVLAYCLEYAEGISFSPGLADPGEPAIAVRDLTGALKAWIDIGAPDADRVHKASKAAPRVAIYTHRDPQSLLRLWGTSRIHKAAQVELYGVDQGLLAELVPRLDRRMTWDLSVTEGHLYLSVAGVTLEGDVSRTPLAAS